MARDDRGMDVERGQTTLPRQRSLETPRAAGVSGLAFAVLFIASIVLLDNAPSGAGTPAEIRHFYLGEHADRVSLVGVYLAPFSGIAFLWFIAVIRNLIGDREDRFFATVFLASGLLFVAMVFVAAGVGGALLAAVKYRHEPIPDQDAVLLVRSFAFGFLFIYAMRMAAVFMIVTSTIGARLGIFPRWLVITGYLAALLLVLNVSYTDVLILVFPVWVAAVSIVILMADRRSLSSARRDAMRTPRCNEAAGAVGDELRLVHRRAPVDVELLGLLVEWPRGWSCLQPCSSAAADALPPAGQGGARRCRSSGGRGRRSQRDVGFQVGLAEEGDDRRPVIDSIVSRYWRSISRWKSWRISMTRPGSPPATIVRSWAVKPLRRTQTMQSSIA